MSISHAGQVSINVRTQPNGTCVCELSSVFGDQAAQKTSVHGQSANHAIARALENLARRFRQDAEAEQKIDWDDMQRSSDGKVIEQRFHVILHYERIADDESKFEAMHNTLLGNTVVESAEITIVKIAPDWPEPVWRDRGVL